MSAATVEQILQKIDSLGDDDRRVLEERLAARFESEWQQTTRDARRIARERGLDQAAVDRAVETVRYQP